MMFDDTQLPEGWTEVSIGDVAEVVGGGTPKTAVAGNFTDDGGHPWITPADLTGYKSKEISRGRRNLSDQGLRTSSARYMPAGTVLFSSRAPIGYVAIAANPVTTNQGFRSFVPSERVNSNYLYYALKLLRPEAEELASGTTFAELSGTNAKKLRFPLAPIDTQVRIADALDRATAASTSATAHLAAAREANERLRRAVLAAACDGRLTSAWRSSQSAVGSAQDLVAAVVEERRTRLGSRYKPEGTSPCEAALPEGWTWTTIGSLVDVATGATPLRRRADYYGGAVPWVTSGAVNAGLIAEAKETITELALKETNAKVFPVGTLLVAMYGEGQTRGRVAELGIAAATNQAVAALLFDKHTDYLRPYLRVFLLENYERIRLMAFGGVQPNLSLGVIKAMRVPLPPRDEQAVIVNRVKAVLNLSHRVTERIAQGSELLGRTSQSVLGKAFRGEMVS